MIGSATVLIEIEERSRFPPDHLGDLRITLAIDGVSSGSGRNDTLSAIGANHAAIASRTPKAFITRSSVSSVGLPLSLNAL